MASASNGQTAIVRTEWGLTIAGTRITLYDVMDYVTAQYPPKLISDILSLTEAQVNAALSYMRQIGLKSKQSIKLFCKKQKRFNAIGKSEIENTLLKLLPGNQQSVARLYGQSFRHKKQAI